MTLRLRLVLAITVLVALATGTVATWGYQVTSRELRNEVADSLTAAASELQTAAERALTLASLTGGETSGPHAVAAVFPERFSPQFTAVLVQVLDLTGAPVLSPEGRPLPVSDADRKLAGSFTSTVGPIIETEVAGEPYLTLTVAMPDGGAVQLARSMAEGQRVLAVTRDTALGTVLVAFAFSILLAWILGTGVVRRLLRLTHVAEEVAETGQLDVEVPAGGSDEAGRLGTAFNRMLTALAESKKAQERLVQDAGHELRTPLTSIRANLSVLRQGHDLSDAERDALLADLDSETRELTDLVNEVVDIASQRYSTQAATTVTLADVVEEVAARSSRRHGREITLDLDESQAYIAAAALERAVSNLVENAMKFDTSGGAIDVRVHQGTVTVLDRGPGIPDSDLDRVFDRFYRSAASRSLPGSGLGLSIVADIVAAAGGTVEAKQRAGGGAQLSFTLPVTGYADA